ncbi:MAG TPA: HD domain-containing protein [Vicinamibacterales bacterium]|jgi:hypothetical protein|nr:HD domain-containing protein [Vicinamibacterales bacterium]
MLSEAREMTLHERLRNQVTKRWHIVHTDREQTVAEHLWAVTIIGWDFYKRMDFTLPFDLWTEYLLTHDITEAITGDLPTPSKKLLKFDGDTLGYDVSKQFAAIDLWANTFDGGLPRAALKVCDLTEAIVHMDRHGRGAHAQSVRRLLFDALVAHVMHVRTVWPAYDWITHGSELFNSALSGPGGLPDGELWLF